MNNFLGQLNLTPQERRVLVITFLVVIFVLNLLFVWPHFGEWGKINQQLEGMRRTIGTDNAFIQKDLDPAKGFKKQVVELSQLEGGHAEEHPVDPQTQLGTTIRAQERKTGVIVQQFNPGTIKTNEFFEELSTAITVQAQEPQLVNFLYNMGMDPAMIRVARLNLQPADANRYALKATITLTANYAKRTTTAAAPPKPLPGTRSAPAPAQAAAPNKKVPPGPMLAPPDKRLHLIPNPPGAGRPQPGGPNPNFPKVPARPFPKPNKAPGAPGTPQ